MQAAQFGPNCDNDITEAKTLLPDAKTKVLAARSIAREVILRLDPEHLFGFPETIIVLEQGLSDAKDAMEVYNAKTKKS